MDQFVYPATLTPDVQDGGFVVTFVDIPEAITQGDDVPEALHHAADCLEEAMAGRIRRRDDIPEPSPAQAGQYAVAVPAQTATKAALYVALRQSAAHPGGTRRTVAVRRKRGPSLARPPSRLEAVASGSGARPLRAANSHRRVPVVGRKPRAAKAPS